MKNYLKSLPTWGLVLVLIVACAFAVSIIVALSSVTSGMFGVVLLGAIVVGLFGFLLIGILTDVAKWLQKRWADQDAKVIATKATKTVFDEPAPGNLGPKRGGSFIDGDKWIDSQNGKLYIRVNRTWTEIDSASPKSEKGHRA